MNKPFTYWIVLCLVAFMSNTKAVDAQVLDTLTTEVGRHYMHPSNATESLVLSDLTVGKYYTFQLTDNLGGASCVPLLNQKYSHFRLIEVNEYLRKYRFEAQERMLAVEIAMPCHSSNKEFAFSLSCEDCPKPSRSRSSTGVQVTQNNDTEDLIDRFLGGSCYEVLNISSKGKPMQFGNYQNATLASEAECVGTKSYTIINGEEGILMSTGNVKDAEGPNKGPSTTTSIGGSTGDRDLAKLIGTSNIKDVVALEFDFIPTIDRASFEYVFASDEYCEYVDTDYNDVFGFFVSGTGINGSFSNGAVNIATIPGSSKYVSINEVNLGSSCEYYVKNAPTGGAFGCSVKELFGEKPVKNLIEYDGLTTLLTAEIDNLVPCDTYHIKLVIADISDGKFDSAVFLKAGSFMAGGNAEASVNIQDLADPDNIVAYESCQKTSFVFERSDDDLSEDIEVNYRVSDASTAQEGFDYRPFGNAAIIKKGERSVSIPIDVIADDLDEGPETIILDFDQACSCESKQIQFTIIDPEPIQAIMDDATTCKGGTVSLSPRLEGGFGKINYDWEHKNLSQLSVREVINEPTSFSVTVTDACGMSASATSNITIEEQTVEITGSELICNGERQEGIAVNLSGAGPWDLTYSRDGEVQPVVKEIMESPYILEDSIAGIYEVIQSESGDCIGEGLPGSAELIVSNLDMDFAPKDPSCFNTEDGTISTVIGGSGNLQYEWSNGATEKNLQNVGAGAYVLTIKDDQNCIYTGDSVLLESPDEIVASFIVEGKVDCYTPLGARVEVVATGGNPDYVYAWKGLSTTSVLSPDATSIDRIGGGDYTVEVTDATGCRTEKVINVAADTLPPLAVARGSNKLSCKVLMTSLSGAGSAETGEIDYLWTTTDGNLVDGESTLFPTIDMPGTYDLIVTNKENGCQNIDQVTVMADYEKPIANVETPTPLNCQITQTRLVATVLEPVDNYSINWATNSIAQLPTYFDPLDPIVEQAGAYNFTVTNDVNGCEEILTVIVEQNIETPRVDLTSDLRLTCEKQTLTLAANVALEEDLYDFNWQTNNSANIISNRNTLSPVVDQPGDYVLTVQNKENFCTTTVDAIVSVDTIKPMANAGNSFVFTCDLETALIEGDADQGADYRYLWTTLDDGEIVDGASSLQPSISRSGTYQITVDNKDNGCSNTSRVTITDDPNRPEAIIEMPDNITCNTGAIVLDASRSSIGNYVWKEENGSVLNTLDSQHPVIDAPGKYTLEITNSARTCTGIASVEVALDTVAPIIQLAMPDFLNCNKYSLELDGTGSSKGPNFNYAWAALDGGTITAGQTTLFPTIEKAGVYALVISDKTNGCTKRQQVSVIEDVPNALNIIANDPPCPDEGGTIAVMDVSGGSGPYRYSIDGGNRYSDNTEFSRLAPGSYQVMVMDANGCTEHTTTNIEPARAIEIELASEMTLALGDSVSIETHTNLRNSEIADIVWTPAIGLSCDDCMQPVARPFASHQYKVEVIDNNGCEATAVINFLVDSNPTIYVPTAFSPNNDGFNDKITIYSKNSVERIKTFKIFNRWGSLVYEKENFSPNDETLGWDGRFGRQVLRPQVFVYFAEVEMINGEAVVLKGDFALME